ncbi:MAG: efflux RND transporter periplasmic adaptor subunit [Planctomycetota bacterium]|nr:efflux RND transporter periplasmic adaptor subunit [Planctomycetota bacterium]
MWKWILGVVVVGFLGCGGGALYLFSSGIAQKYIEKYQPGAKLTEVRLEPVTRGELVKTVSAPGQIEPQIKVEISAEVVAKILKMPFEENDRVKQGDLLVELDSRDLRASLDAAQGTLRGQQAQLAGARADLARSAAELGRKRELFASKDISKSELDLAEADYLQSEARVQAAEFAVETAAANVDRAQRDLENTEIRSPLDGIVTRKVAEVGEVVVQGTLNNPGSIIMEVADMSRLLMKARIDESNIAPVAPGQKATVYVNAFASRTFEGEVLRVRPQQQIDRDGTKYFEVEVLVKPPEEVRLLSGMSANVDIHVESLADVLKVPSQALVDRAIEDLPREIVDASPHVDRAKKFARVVYKLVDGKAVGVPVAVGASDLTMTVVLAGLEPEDEIITGPAKALISLKDGQRLARMAEPGAANAVAAGSSDEAGESEPEGDGAEEDVQAASSSKP